MAKVAIEGKWERYSRQILFAPIGEEGQQKLQNSRVAIIGLGALGTVSANCLARAGVGFLRLVDRDFVEPSNLQRQLLFTEQDAERVLPKAQVAGQRLAEINSAVEYETLVEDVNYLNVHELIQDTDLVLDATDNFEVRYLVNEACVKKGIPWIHGACVASYGLTLNIIPGKTPCLACFLGELPPRASFAGTCDTAGIISPIVNVIASIQSAEALKLLTGNLAALRAGVLFIDLWDSRFDEFKVSIAEDCPVCRQRRFPLLSGERQQRTASLCGRDAVQILPAHKLSLSLAELEQRLSALGKITSNGFLLKFAVDRYEIVVFPDGRALIKGTTDEKLARSLYARYIGA